MNTKKIAKPTRKDIRRQKIIEEKIEVEGVKLNHPKDKERFENGL